MPSPESILHVGKFYPPHPGGIETHLRDLVRIQSRTSRVEVLVAGNAPVTRREILDGATITRVATFGSIASQPVVPALPLYLRRHREQIIHLHTPNPGGAFAWWTSRHPGKLVISHHGDTAGRPTLRRISGPFVNAAMRSAAAILVSSQRYLDSSTELAPYRDKCRIVPLGIDLSAQTDIDPARIEAIRARYGPRIVLSTGRLVPYKGFAYLIQAMRGVNANLLLAGTGPLRTQLETLARQQNVAGKTHFLGYVPSLQPYLRAADVFVLPSITRAESFGIVQLEAMAAGLPVINTWLDSAVPEVSLDGVTGITVAPADAAALTQAIQALLSNDTLRRSYSQAAIQRAHLFTAEATADSVGAVYSKVLG